MAALNCWVQNGDCHQHFPKIRSFPLILGYVGGNKGIQFRGPLQYTYIDRFVQNLLRPLERVETASDLYKLLSQHNVSIKLSLFYLCTFLCDNLNDFTLIVFIQQKKNSFFFFFFLVKGRSNGLFQLYQC